MKQIYANNQTTIQLGRQGENLARQVIFDLADWIEGYGDGVVELIVRRPGDEKPYPVAVTREGSNAVWTLTATDMAVKTSFNNCGQCELRWYVGEILAKSYIWRTCVEPAMDTPAETAPPGPEQGWVDQVAATGAAAKAAAKAAKAEADRAADMADDVVRSIGEAGSCAVKQVQDATLEGVKTIRDAGSEERSSLENAGDAQIERIKDEGETQTTNAKSQADAAALSAADAAQSAQEAAESAAVYGEVVSDVTQLKADVAAITPDNTAINEKPWTSKKIVDTLCQPIEESGNPVQCYPVENYPLGVKVSWEPVQKGEGDPSPDNVRPITGTAAVQIVHSNDAGEANTYDIALPETVYGGTLDLETGVLTVEWGYSETTLGDTSRLPVVGDGFVRKSLRSIGMTSDKKDDQKCNIAPFDYNFNGAYTHFYHDINGYAMIIVPSDTPADTVIQMSVKLANPYTIQLTPQQITALSGVNTIYTDANGVIVTGAEDPKHTITQLKNAIISLGGNI